MKDIAEYFKVYHSTVSRGVEMYETYDYKIWPLFFDFLQTAQLIQKDYPNTEFVVLVRRIQLALMFYQKRHYLSVSTMVWKPT